MLLNLHKKSWIDGLTLRDYSDHCHTNDSTVKDLLQLAKNYNKVRYIYALPQGSTYRGVRQLLFFHYVSSDEKVPDFRKESGNTTDYVI